MSEQPHRGPRDDDEFDARFADIISTWDLDAAPARPDPAAPEAPTPSSGSAARSEPSARENPPAATGSGQQARPTDPQSVFGAAAAQGGWRVHVPPEEPDEDFVPGPVAPLPRGDLTFWGALVGLVAGPLWLIYLVVFHRDDGHLPMVAAIALAVGGFALMVWRLPSRAPDDEDDDGAVV